VLGETLSKARGLIKRYRLCDACLGRLLSIGGGEARSGPGGSELKARLLEDALSMLNDSRDEAVSLIKALYESGYKPAEKHARELGADAAASVCPICFGRLREEVLDALVSEAVSKVEGYEFSDFLVGALIPKYIASIEERIVSEFGLAESETLRKEVARRVGGRLVVVLGKPVNFTSPEMLILIDIFTGTVEARPAPLYILGHYFKRVPNVPQTPWYCPSCWGAGCGRCGGLGRIYPDSVAEYIGEPSMEMAEAIGYRFHAAGREDVDVTVEEGGRPFILELSLPRRRSIDLEALEAVIRERSGGRVEVSHLRRASRRDLDLLKESVEGAVKRYSALVTFERPVGVDELGRVESALRSAVIEQWTPVRVIRRRGERLRRKRVVSVRARLVDERTVELELEAEGGLYVKELIHGDGGRTRPSIAELLGNTPLRISLRFLGVAKSLYPPE